MFEKKKVEVEWCGKKLILETGKIGRQADSTVVATYGGTTVMANVCAAKSGFSERTARTIDRGQHHTQQLPQPRQYKTRESIIDSIWESQLRKMLEENPTLQPMTLLLYIQREYQNNDGTSIYPDSCLRTLQRRVRDWKAKHGPGKNVIFAQKHYPGEQGLSDFTHMTNINITINFKPLKHMLYQFRLVYSNLSSILTK